MYAVVFLTTGVRLRLSVSVGCFRMLLSFGSESPLGARPVKRMQASNPSKRTHTRVFTASLDTSSLETSAGATQAALAAVPNPSFQSLSRQPVRPWVLSINDTVLAEPDTPLSTSQSTTRSLSTMRRGIPRVPARVPPPGPADLSSSPSSGTTLSPPPSLSTPPQSCPPPTPLIPLFAALAIIALLTPILYHFFSRSPSLANLSVLLRSPTLSSNGPGGGPEDVHFVLKSLTSYRSAQSSSLKTKRASFKKLGGPQRVLARQLGYPERQERLREAGESNARFLEGMVGLAKREVEGAAGFSASKGGRGDQGRVHEMVKQ